MGRQGKGRCQGEPQLDMYRSNREKDQQGKGAEGLGRVWTVKPAGRPLYGEKERGPGPIKAWPRWETQQVSSRGGRGTTYRVERGSAIEHCRPVRGSQGKAPPGSCFAG